MWIERFRRSFVAHAKSEIPMDLKRDPPPGNLTWPPARVLRQWIEHAYVRALSLVWRVRPKALFDEKYYLASYPDVSRTGMTPLYHYLQYGAREGRKPNPLFDSR